MIYYRNYILIIMMLCNLEIGAAASDEHKKFVDALSEIYASGSGIYSSDDMDIVDGHCSSESESESQSDFETALINTNADVNSNAKFPSFEHYFCVGKLPYSDPDRDDALLWRVRLNVGEEAIEVQRLVGARAFIDVLKKRYQEYGGESMVNMIAGVGREYAQCDDGGTHNNRLDQIEQVENVNRSSEIGLCYAKPEEHDCLGCPLLARRIITHIRNFPRKTQYTHAEFNSWVQERLKWCDHEGSYAVSADPTAIKGFVEVMVALIGNVKSTNWQLVQIDE